ncbi:KIF-binding protein-like [Prorops nasuta]|uniref:KIF-binding protein-like n=1 Tax=Prorops nasuta TaxID=863751 RepID=UPI0034CE04D8
MNEAPVVKLYFQKLCDEFVQLRELQKSKKKKDNGTDVEVEVFIDRTIGKIEEIRNWEKNSRLSAMRAALLYEKSKSLIARKEEKLAQDILIKILKDLKDIALEREVIFIVMRVRNHIAYFLCKEENYVEARKILEIAGDDYETLKKNNSVMEFFTSEELFCVAPETDTSNKLERLVTNNFQMLAFISNKLGLHDKFAEYHHMVLDRQLMTKENDVAMWAIKSAKLALYLFEANRFKEAKHHLLAAVRVLKLDEKNWKNDKKDKEFENTFANIAKCWIKYGLALFDASKAKSLSIFQKQKNPMFGNLLATNKLLNSEESMNKNDNNNQDTKLTNSKTADYQGPYLFYESINLSLVEDEVDSTLVESTNDARSLFNYIYSWYEQAVAFYTLQDHPMEFLNTNLDLCELYGYLAFYEEDIESQYELQKFRADILESLIIVVKEIKPQCYISILIETLKELAEIQVEMMSLNLRRIYAVKETQSVGNIVSCKMGAICSIHSCLEQFGNSIIHLEASCHNFE